MAYALYTLKLMRTELQNASQKDGIDSDSSEYLISKKLRTQLCKALDQLIQNEKEYSING